MLKVGVIGTGSMGRHHVRVMSEIENVELVGISDPDETRAELAAKHQTRFFNDHHALLAAGLDLVTIAAPTSLHHAIGCDAIAAGCHLLMEKPVSDDLAKANELVAKADAAGRIIAAGHIERFNPAVVALKKLIDAGELGEVLAVNNLRVSPYHGRILDTGIVLDIGIHDVDLISMLLGEQPERVFATAMTKFHTHEDHSVISLAYPGGWTGVIETSWQAPYRARHIFVIGTKHFATVDLVNQTLQVYDDNPEANSLAPRPVEVAKGEPLRAEVESVVASVLNGEPPACSAADSIQALKACFAALESIRTGQSQTV